jgi:hypothetical protein
MLINCISNDADMRIYLILLGMISRWLLLKKECVMKLMMMFCSAVFFVNGIGLAQQAASATPPPDLIVIYGTAVSYDASQLAYDGPAILKVRSEEDSTQWEVTSGGFRSCASYTGNLSGITGEKVTIRGEMKSSGKLDVCRAGTYIKTHGYRELKVDSIITLKGSVEYYDPTPTYVDGLGILIIEAFDGELWDISFGGMRLPGCTAPFPYHELDKGEKIIAVAGKMLKNGTLDVCAEGTYVTFGTSVVDRHASQPFTIEKSSLVQKGRTQVNCCTVAGRKVTTGSRDVSNMSNDVPSESISFKQKRISKQIIVHP